MRRTSLAVRISALVAGSCLITSVVAGSLATNLIAKSASRNASQTLSRLADAAQATADQPGSAQAGQTRAIRTLRALKIDVVRVSASGTASGGSTIARQSLSDADLQRLLTVGRLALDRRVAGHQIIVEGRGTRAGGIVLVQRRSDATAGGDQAIRRVLLGLLIGTVLAIGLGLAFSRRIALPLRRTADAAHALAAGRRDISVPVAGPSEVAEVGSAVNSLAAALVHSEGRQRDFLLSISHDLRTPLTAISGYAESLADGVIPPEQAAQTATIIGAEAQRLTRLVSDLLDLARLEADDFRLNFSSVDVVRVVDAAAQVWRLRCESVGVILQLQVPAGAVLAWTDPSRLRQVLDGLLENALRVTPSGAPIVLAVRRPLFDPASLDSAPSDPGGLESVVVEVRDGGPGLSDDDFRVAFERSVLFQRYQGVRRVGTGLGLAIVHGLVQRLGARIEAGHSREGGARFTIELPAVPRPAGMFGPSG